MAATLSHLLADYPGMLKNLLSLLDVGFLLATPDGQILMANEEVRTLFGYEPEDLVAKDLSLLFTPEDLDVFYPNLLYLARKHRPFEGVAMLQRQNESRFFARLILSPHVKEQTGETGVAVVVRNIDDLKSMERKVLIYDSEILRQASTGLSDGIRGPLQAIFRALKGVLAEGQTREQVRRQFQEALFYLKRMDGLLQKHHQLVALDPPHLSRVRSREILTEILDPYLAVFQEKNVILDDRLEDETLLLDKKLVGLGLRIIFDLSLSGSFEERHLIIQSLNRDNFYRLGVSIVGTDFGPEDLTAAADPFHQTRVEGLGLDLAVIRRVMEFHQGQFQAEYDPKAAAAVFTLVFPWERRRFIRNWRLDEL